MSTAEDLEAMRKRLTVDQLYQMVEAEIVDPDERVELIDGMIVSMAAQNPAHASLVRRIAWGLSGLQAQQSATVCREQAIVLGSHDELYPEISVVRFREDDYAKAHPAAADTFLVVEVSDATLRRDRMVKLPEYARAGIPEVWIANVRDRQIEVHREPAGSEYRVTYTAPARPGSTVAPARFPDLALAVDDLFRYV
jgi:Uma2 family endonuclease